MLKQTLEKLCMRIDLSSKESKSALQAIFGGANSYQTAAFLMLMRSKGETVEELFGMIEGMKELMVRVSVKNPLLDIVGTGGDGAHTLNISTASAILAASCGVKVAKHGNRSVSSLCGSADVLEALGIDIIASKESVARSIEELGIGFLFAPEYHPALKQLKELRKGLGTRTLFNLIAPFLNPASPEHFMIGVYREELLETAAELLARLNTRRSLVFHGNGLDELTCLGPVQAIEVSDGELRPCTLDPEKFGLRRCCLEDLKGKDAVYNAQKIREAFNGEESPFAETIALNAGVAMHLYGKTSSIQEGIAEAKRHLQEKKASELLNRWRDDV